MCHYDRVEEDAMCVFLECYTCFIHSSRAPSRSIELSVLAQGTYNAALPTFLLHLGIYNRNLSETIH